MALLLSVMLGEGVVVQDGRLCLPDPTDKERLILADADDLTALEELGWLSIDADCASVTDRGVYWTRRYLTKRPEFRRVATLRGVLAATQ